MMNILKVLRLIMVMMVGVAGITVYAQEPSAKPEPMKGIFLSDLRLIPVQSGGRIKPFDEFARETIFAFTGSRSFENFDPSEMLISMMVKPDAWAQVPFIRISNEEVRKQFLMDVSRKYFSPAELMKNNAFLQYAEGVLGQGSAGQVTSTGVNVATGVKDPRNEELKRVVDRVSRYQGLVQGKLWAVTPPKDKNPEGAWSNLSEGMTAPSLQSGAVYGLLKSYLDQDAEKFKESAAQARMSVESGMSDFEAHDKKLKAEVFYNRLRPFLQAMIFYIIAGILWLFATTHAFPRIMAKFLTFSGFVMHVLGFALRCYIAGRPPVTNMYESIIWVSLGVMIFAVILFSRFKQVVLMSTATFLAGLTLFGADAAPLIMDPTIRPLVPVLRSNYWLTIHVLTITLSYGAFTLAMGIANISLFQFFRISRAKALLQSASTTSLSQRIALLNQLAYRTLMFGTVLLAAGTILGGVWADYSWGRFWGWDPKEVWALIALLSYMAVLHGRYAGWVGTFAFPLWTVICYSTVVMAWYGVNFVLGVGLHSYGFSSGGQASVFGFILFQTAYCLWIAYEHQHVKKLKAVS